MQGNRVRACYVSSTLMEVSSKTSAWQDAMPVVNALEAQARLPGSGLRARGTSGHRVEAVKSHVQLSCILVAYFRCESAGAVQGFRD